MKKAFQFCQEDTGKPPLPTSPPSLASAYEHPDKAQYHSFHATSNNKHNQYPYLYI